MSSHRDKWSKGKPSKCRPGRKGPVFTDNAMTSILEATESSPFTVKDVAKASISAIEHLGNEFILRVM
ncbi:MAG: hypothetical protein KOO60_02050 [Gemmatimonadales bacterium]|nr:hypothetical protein [Gemmatimonadales bacterium]